MAYQHFIAASVLALGLTAPQAALAAPAQAANDGSKVVCREILPVGTILRKQLVCMDRAAWNKTVDQRREKDDFSREYLRLKQPARPDMVQLGKANWDKLPPLMAKGKVPYVQLATQAQEFLRKGTCTIPGQSSNKFDIDIRYGAMFDEQGQISRVLVEDSKCEMLNALAGLTVLARAERGDFKGGKRSAGTWYADHLNLTLE